MKNDKKEKIKKENRLIKILKNKKVLIILAIVVIGFLVWRSVSSKKDDAETVEVKKGTVTEELILSGEISADEYTNLTFQSSGRIIWVGVSEGDWVKKGQALAKLDTTKLNADLQRARSDLRSADASVEKAHDDVKDHDSDETYTQKETRTIAEVAKDKAYEAVLKAEEDLRNATLTAPFSGLITYIANPFSSVHVLYTQTQFEIVNPETIFFEVAADQSEILDLEEGKEVSIVLDSFLEKEFKGNIKYIGFTPKADEIGTMYEIKVEFSSEDLDVEKIRIGMSGDAEFILSQKENVLYIPPQFINSDKEGKYVYKNSKKNKVYIEIGLEGEERVEITGDIKEGDTLYD
ncbi:MAG: efflux RND transporter periplasmic adaptor subunit [Microgenomates group bacterium]